MMKIFSFILIVFLASKINFSNQSSISVPDAGYRVDTLYKKYFGFPNISSFLSGRRSSNQQNVESDAINDAEPRRTINEDATFNIDAITKDANKDREITDLSQLASAASNHELLNTINLVINSRKSCPENHFQCSSTDASSASIFSINQTPGLIHSSSYQSSVLSMFPGMRNGQTPKCVPDAKICDGVKDCPNLDDESEHRCRCWQEPNHFKCRGPSSKCIPKDWICDKIKDCPFGDDEDADICTSANVSNVSMTTSNGHGVSSIKLWYVCRGRYSKYQERIDKILIPLNLNGHRNLIPVKWLCDGRQDCEKGDDEKFCDPPYPSVNVSNVSNELNVSNGSSINGSISDPLEIVVNGTSMTLTDEPSTLSSAASVSMPLSLLASLSASSLEPEPSLTLNGEEEAFPLTTPFNVL